MTKRLMLAVAALLAFGAPASAQPTDVVVRVISQDAKFVGDSMGGAEVILRDAQTGRVLAKGVTRGGTGDTDRIMASTGRSPQRATDSAAAFRTRIDVDRPTLVRVEIRGPLAFPDTVQRASSERWLIPGQSVSADDGWVVELPGLAIRIPGEAPALFHRGRASGLAADVQLMCGCPITPGGLWNAADYEVIAEIRQAGTVVDRVTLPFVSAPGRFGTQWTPRIAGDAEMTFIARNRVTGNTGVLSRMITVK